MSMNSSFSTCSMQTQESIEYFVPDCSLPSETSVKAGEKLNKVDDCMKPTFPDDSSVNVSRIYLDCSAAFETCNGLNNPINQSCDEMSDMKLEKLHLDTSVKAVDESFSQAEDAGSIKEGPSENKNTAITMDTESTEHPDTTPKPGYPIVSNKEDEKTYLTEQMKESQVELPVHTPRCVLIQPSEVPSGEQLEKLLSMQSTNYDLQCPPKWIEGDMLWAKVSGHPYWPSMVSRCPFSKMYTRVKGDTRVVRSYHIQFFGNEAERGWVNEASLIVFEGKMKFLDMVQQEQSKRKSKGANSPFKINISRQHAWDIAVEEAEEAMHLSREKRNVQYIFDYVFVNDLIREQKRLKMELQKTAEIHKDDLFSSKPRPGEKRKRVSFEENVLRSVLCKSKRQKLEVATSTMKPSGAETSFDTYYANHRSLVIEQHPDWDTALVFEYLRQKWESEKIKTPKSTKSSFSRATAGLKEARLDSQVVKSLDADDQISYSPKLGNGVPAGTPSLSHKKSRPKKTTPSTEKETAMDATQSLSVSSESLDRVPEIGEEKGKPKSAACTSAQKAVQEFEPQGTEKRGKNQKGNNSYELEIFKLNSTCKIDKDNVCAVCEKNGDVIQCTGPCAQYFHSLCIALESSNLEQYLCAECTSDCHTCFSCKKADVETIKCSVNLCGKYYHEDCIRKYRLSRLENKGFICPLHTCATCAVDNVKNPKAVKGRFYRCVRCPTAYHVADFCIAAGSVNLAGSQIVCSDHFEPNKSQSCHSRINITWCFSCSKGGTLLCCESCPAAFHSECAEVDKTPEEAWFCEDCSAGRKPLYGNIVWIKVGSYRWWPGEICHPKHVPVNIQDKPHQVGEFPVRFFGSHDYYWIHKGRVFLFEEGDRGSKEGSSRGLFKVYMKGVKEATEAFQQWTAAKAKKVEQEQERSDKKPAPYKFIKSNIPVGNVQIYKAELSEIPKCDCKPDQEDACTSECLNRVMMYECHPSTCPAGNKCHNQRFQQQQYPECEPFKSESRGWGLRCLEDLKKGQFVLEYVGDLIDEEECKRRIAQAHEDNITNFYMLTLDKNRIIDAGPRGNFSRFMNHSCQPNLETQKWTVNGDIRVGFFALCDIPKGSEVTFNYNLECLGNGKKACACGSQNCSGFLGVRPKATAAVTNDKKSKESRKKRRKKKLAALREHENDCFRCGVGGQLVMCDKNNCPKVYHLRCLKLTKPPTGKWLCPWHHCDECGKLATVMCSECPNSFCQPHAAGNIFKSDDMYVCGEHKELLQGILQSLGNCGSDGINDMKPEIKTMTTSHDSEESTDANMDKLLSNGTGQQAAVRRKRSNVVANAESSINKGSSCNLRYRSLRNLKPKEDASKESLLQQTSKVTVLSGLENSLEGADTPSADQKIPASVRYSNRLAGIQEVGKLAKPKRQAEVTICRTKARYKARLSSASITDSKAVGLVDKSVADLQSRRLRGKLTLHHLNQTSSNGQC